jgi:adenosylhomocysteine nucleosidase
MGTAEGAKLLLVASEPGELRGILARSKAVRRLRWPVWFARIGELNGNRLILVANGPGAELATAGIRAALERSRPEAVISTGFCGALDPAIAAGEVFVAGTVEADGSHYAAAMPQTDGRFFRTGTLLSLNRVIATAAEKAELRKRGAAAVDMEAGAVALEACRNQLPFYCIRAVLDRATEGFVLNFNFLRGADGRFSRKLILKAAIKRPAACLPELIRLGWRGRRASRDLGEFLGNCEF